MNDADILHYGIREPEIDDRAPCRRCGAPISDVECDDNHGYCNSCIGESGQN